MNVSMVEVREAELIAKAQRIAAGEGSGVFDQMLGDRNVNRLFNDGALFFERPN